MCGIIGIVGRAEVAGRLMDGLRRLEYRGYDSAGMYHAIRRAADGMQVFTMSLKQLIDDGLIDRPTAFEVAPNPDALKMALKGIEVKDPGII